MGKALGDGKGIKKGILKEVFSELEESTHSFHSITLQSHCVLSA